MTVFILTDLSTTFEDNSHAPRLISFSKSRRSALNFAQNLQHGPTLPPPPHTHMNKRERSERKGKGEEKGKEMRGKGGGMR